MNHCFRRLALRAVLLTTLITLTVGCSVAVKKTTLAEEATSYVLFSEDKNPKSVFSPNDKQVTLHVQFEYNVVASTQRFRVIWFEPSGQAYVAGPVSTLFGSNHELIVSLKIKDAPAAKKLGIWTVKLFHNQDELVTQQFEIR